MTAMSVSRPGTLSGFSRSRQAAAAGVAVGPTLQPIGLPTPRRNSTSAP